MFLSSRSVRVALLVAALPEMSGCGGGGSSSVSVPTAPVLNLAPQGIKTFRFTWTDVSGENEYRLLESPDGVSGYTQLATIAADAVSHDLVVSLPKRINARYILQACNGAGCADSAPALVSGTLAQAVGYAKASNTGAGDHFGSSVALSADGNTIAVSAIGEASNATGIGGDQSGNSASDSGAVYIFTRSGPAWAQQAYVKASNTGAGDHFGSSIALSADGNTLAVGAPEEDSNATGVSGNQSDDSAGTSGAVYLFTRSGSAWSQQAYVKASNTGAGDHFGSSVALSADGNTLAVSATGEASNATGIGGNQSDDSAGESGAVYLFTRSGSAWTQQAYVKASNTGAGDHFGSSIALSADGNTLAVGAPEEDSNATGVGGNQSDNSADYSGAAYLFTRSGSTWSQQAYVKASNTELGDQFGFSVALSADGNTLAVGAYAEDSNATGIGGNQSDNSAGYSGAVYLFTRGGSAWSQQAYVKGSNTEAIDCFGMSVALSADGNTLAVGASGESSNAAGVGGNQSDNSASNSGAVYLFTRGGSAWSQQAYLKASNAGADDNFGYSVALSADGNTLAVGAPYESSNATGIGGDQSSNSASYSGAVYLY
jgi:hypothetical protein